MESQQLGNVILGVSAMITGVAGAAVIILKLIDSYYKDKRCHYIEEIEAIVSSIVHQKIPDYDSKLEELNKKREQDIRDLNEKRDRDKREIDEKRERDLDKIERGFKEFTRDFK